MESEELGIDLLRKGDSLVGDLREIEHNISEICGIFVNLENGQITRALDFFTQLEEVIKLLRATVNVPKPESASEEAAASPEKIV